MTIAQNYQSINQILNQLRALLIEKLHNCYVEKEATDSFTELIKAVSEIKANEVINDNNTMPSRMPDIDHTDISKFNISLYKRIRYYMKLLGYYLVLKGVPVVDVNNQTDLKGLIELIDRIDVLKPSSLALGTVDETQYYGTDIEVPYTLKDVDDNNITEGDITIKDNEGIVYDSIRAGAPILITPLHVSDKVNNQYQYQTFTITYNGSDNYLASTSQTIRVKILPAKIRLSLTLTNVTTKSKYYNSKNTGYQIDDWEVKIRTLNHEHQPLSEIPFILTEGDFVLEGETNNNGTYIFNRTFEQQGEHTITCETVYEETDKMTNVSVEYSVQIKYNVLSPARKTYTGYANNSYTYNVNVVNEDTGEPDNRYNNRGVNVFLNNVQNESPSVITNHSVSYTLNNITVGNHILKWELGEQNFIMESVAYINILSNFILPTETKYFLNDTPEIIYKPNGQIENNAVINGTIKYTDIDGTLYAEESITLTNDSNGRLDTIENYKNAGSYVLTLCSSNGEVVIFEYDLISPFIINRTTFDRTIGATYEIIFFDKEGTYTLSILHNGQEMDSSLYTLTESQDKIIFSISTNENTTGKNTLSVAMNGYEQSVIFRLNTQLFKMLTSSVNLDEDIMQIECSDDTVENIEIKSEYIKVIDIERVNNVFNVRGYFIKAGLINFTITDEEGSVENFNIQVNKANIINNVNAVIYVDKSDLDDERTNTQHISYTDEDKVRFLFNIDTITLYSDLSINFLITTLDNQVICTQPFIYNKGGSNNIELTLPDLLPDIYIAKFVFNGDNNYEAFSKNIEFTIIKNRPYFEYEIYSGYAKNGDVIFHPDLNGTTPIRKMHTDNYSQENGIIIGNGFLFTEGWDNTIKWQCDFDFMHKNIKNTGIGFVGSPNAIPTTQNFMVESWEGRFFNDQQYATTNDNQVGWFHVTIRKLSDTTLQIIIPDYHLYYEGVFSYLPQLTKVTCGALHSSDNTSGPCEMKNIIVRRLD